MRRLDLRLWRRGMVKALLKPLLRWRPLADARPGYSIILGTPWALRHLLCVNLRFIERMDLQGLDRIYVVFDRMRQPGADEIITETRQAFPRLPLEFDFHPRIPGWIVQRVNQSKFYASLNWVTGIKRCRTKYAILHDFDLYPTYQGMFRAIYDNMRARGLRFSGVEHTHFDGLDDADALIGTWELGVDAEWLRSRYRPTQCFHAIAPVNGRPVDLDAFSKIQSKTAERALANGIPRPAFAHVTNLCSTYLRLTGGQKVAVAWRLHYLWYLQSLAGEEAKVREVIEAMRAAQSSTIRVDARELEFADVHVTCSNVLRDDLTIMEKALFGANRPVIEEYVGEFRSFLTRWGDNKPLTHDRCKSPAVESSDARRASMGATQ